MSASMWIRLSIMMLLQYWIWGAWGAYLPVYLRELEFGALQIGAIMSMLYFASMFAPIVGGQITDRYLSSEKFLGIMQLLGGVFLFIMAEQTEFFPFIFFMFLWAVVYSPTLPITNIMCFRNLTDVEREFGWIRFWGTIGWILSGWALTAWLYYSPDGENCLRLAAVASIIMGFFSFILPSTPPKKEGGHPLAFVEAFSLLKRPSFLAFMVISFVVATELMFYYVLTSPFLEDIGTPTNDIPAWMTLAQIAEIISLLVLLPLILPRVSIKTAMLIGILAWPVRYVIFAIGDPWWLVIASLPLHGLCYVFFFVVGQIYVDKVAPESIRSSAQSLLFFVTFGLGLTSGSYFAGWIQWLFTDANDVVNWTGVFLVPVFLTILCAIGFIIFFKEPKEDPDKPVEQGDLPEVA